MGLGRGVDGRVRKIERLDCLSTRDYLSFTILFTGLHRMVRYVIYFIMCELSGLAIRLRVVLVSEG